MAKHNTRTSSVPGASPAVMSLRGELRGRTMRPIGTFALHTRSVEILSGRDSIWAIVRRGEDGGLAIRAAHVPGGGFKVRRARRKPGEALRLEIVSAIGVQTVVFAAHAIDMPVLRVTTSIVPDVPLLIAHLPRDVYPLGPGDDPLTAAGNVEAAQRGLNGGICYFRLQERDFGAVLYFQNLTRLNDYFIATKTKPDGAVGGEWPELGYLPPAPPQAPVTPVDPLPAGRDTTLSDAFIAFHDDSDGHERASALHFLQLLGSIYRLIDHPDADYNDWLGRARKTLHDLETAPEASIRHYGHRYIHPYTASEYPDVMVQMSIIASLRDFAAWSHKPIALEAELAAGLAKFHDRTLKTMRRYLPNVGKDKDKDAVDSWYLYHPLLNLGKMALDGDARAKRLFTGSLDYAITAAKHFDYAWPIQFKVDDFAVITEARNDDGLGQTDVGGIYAYVMLQAYELTREERFVAEARAAIDAARNMRFELQYQANLTAWGATACIRLWRITADRDYLFQSYVYLASFFHNCVLWESEIDGAAHYRTFLGPTALHDAPYMALYECFDSFAAFERYLQESGPDLDPAVRLMVSEYCRYAPSRAWFYYPDTLPADLLATDIRNGHIDRTLSFPVEDLYADGQPPGQVGQEIYGAGAAFVFASRLCHPIEGASFMLVCDHFLVSLARLSARSISIELAGGESSVARLSIVPDSAAKRSRAKVARNSGETIRVHHRAPDRTDYIVPGSGRLIISW